MSNNINNIFIHLLCDDVEIEKKIFAFEEGKSKHILLETPPTNQNVSDVDDNIPPRRFDITLVDDPNVKLLGNYSEITNDAEILRLTQPLCLSDWKHFINQRYDNQKQSVVHTDSFSKCDKWYYCRNFELR